MALTIDHKNCPICGTKIVRPYEGATQYACRNGCVEYDVDPQGESVEIHIFRDGDIVIVDGINDEDWFLFELYDNTKWQFVRSDDKYGLEAFKKRVEYWKENERYLAEILRRC